MTYILSWIWIFKEKSYICIKTSDVFVGTLKYIDVFSKYDDTLEYQEAEVNSRIRKIGLWADPQRIAPWDFRKK